MKLKKLCLLLFGVLFLMLLAEIACISNYNHQENLITDEDRRAADYDERTDQTKKRGLYESSGTHNGHQSYPSEYGESSGATFTNPGYSYLPSSMNQYHPTLGSGYGAYPSEQSSFGYGSSLFGQTGQGISHGQGGSHGHGHSGLALKGLLIPLAGIALLGAAAALSTNPVLLQLGVVNGRRRRRRSFSSDAYPANPRVSPDKK